jgi:hypothetical protein
MAVRPKATMVLIKAVDTGLEAAAPVVAVVAVPNGAADLEVSLTMIIIMAS